MKIILIVVSTIILSGCINQDLINLRNLKAECADLKKSLEEINAKDPTERIKNRKAECIQQGWW